MVVLMSFVRWKPVGGLTGLAEVCRLLLAEGPGLNSHVLFTPSLFISFKTGGGNFWPKGTWLPSLGLGKTGICAFTATTVHNSTGRMKNRNFDFIIKVFVWRNKTFERRWRSQDVDFINSITHIKWLLAAISVTTKKFSTGSFRVAVHNRIFCTEQEVTSGRLLYNSK